MARINDPSEIGTALERARTIAVVGCSPRTDRPSSSIAGYLLEAGFDVIPVNPAATEILGRPCYPDVASIPREVKIDIVDVFRRSDQVSEVAEAAIARGVGFFWMQEGVADAAAAERLVAAGIPVAMDRCIFRDRETLRRGQPLR